MNDISVSFEIQVWSTELDKDQQYYYHVYCYTCSKMQSFDSLPRIGETVDVGISSNDVSSTLEVDDIIHGKTTSHILLEDILLTHSQRYVMEQLKEQDWCVESTPIKVGLTRFHK